MVLMLDIKLNNIQFHLMDLAGGNQSLPVNVKVFFLLITISVKLSYTNI